MKNKYDLIASELSMFIFENDYLLEIQLYNLAEDYIKEFYPDVPKNAYFNIIDHAFKIYQKM